MAGERKDPLIASVFHMELEGTNVGTVKEVDGIEYESDVRELMQVGPDGKMVMIKSQGAMPVKMGKITVKYAAFKGDKVQSWRQEVIEGKMEKARKNLTIKALTVENKPAMEWTFKNAWPSKYSWSAFNATSNDPIMVTVEIEHEGIEQGK